jgi:hypothetical protein
LQQRLIRVRLRYGRKHGAGPFGRPCRICCQWWGW